MLVDFGAKVDGYCSDHTRCIFCGEPNRKQEEAYEKLQETFKQILKEIKPGRKVAEISAKYREYLHCCALDFPSHSLGHGIGLEVHEYPSFADASGDVVREDSTLAIEPSTYYKEFGARFEETVLVTKNGARII
ncbi:Xaa-Pro dipeptidase [uncultured archaeon]|nr:Xaa-Pro dipeptidase [uncultured archaeon]